MNNNTLINNVSRVKAKCLRLSDAFLAIYQQDLKFRSYLWTEIDHKTPQLSVPASFTSLIQPPEPSETELWCFDHINFVHSLLMPKITKISRLQKGGLYCQVRDSKHAVESIYVYRS